MSIFIDELAKLAQQSIDDADATREDWERALDQVFPIEHLDALRVEAHPVEHRLAWEIDQDGNSAAEAAITVWQQVFRRGPFQPNADEACVFTVTNPETGDTAEVDLSDEKFADLFR